MSKTKRTRYSAEFKGKVALEALKGEKTIAELARELASALHRPAVFRVPMLALRLQFGEGATAIASGQRALPERLMKEGFTFRHTELGEAVRACL